jgi:hypothetical protein
MHCLQQTQVSAQARSCQGVQASVARRCSEAWSQICAGPRPGRDGGRGRPKRERDQFGEEEGEVSASDIGSRQKRGPGSA